MKNQPVTEECPLGLWDEGLQGTLNLLGGRGLGELETACQPGDMGINDDSVVEAESIPENHIGGFATHASESDQGFHGCGDGAVVRLNECLATGLNVFGFVPKKPDGTEFVLEFF